MIKSQNRAKWFGASDTHFIMGNWNTVTFRKWWAVKLGLIKNNYKSTAMTAGTYWEHRIANYIDKTFILDRQIKIRKYRLRVNLDAETKDTIHEIKTRSTDWAKVPKQYIEQVQVQMWATKKRKAVIDAYTLVPEDYSNFFRELDSKRLEQYDIHYDAEFIEKYKLRLLFLAKCLRRGILPTEELWNLKQSI